MEAIYDNYSASDAVNFQSGVNLGYSLKSWNGKSKVLESVSAIIKRNPNSPFCRGISLGVEKAIQDIEKNNPDHFNDRMSELRKNRDNNKDSKEIEL